MVNLIYQIIPFFLYIGVPAFFLMRLWYDKKPSLEKWWMETAMYGTYIVSIFLIGLWPMVYGFYIRYILIALFFLIVLKSFHNCHRTSSIKFFSLKEVCYCLTLTLLTSIFILNIYSSIDAQNSSKASIDLKFPLQGGDFYIAHGGSNQIINHHFEIPAQKYALDVIQLNEFGFRANHVNPSRLTDYNIFNAVVYSPCDGIVVEIADNFDDLKPNIMDSEHPAGNYIAIAKSQTEIIIILAHLRKGSLEVKVNDHVRQGQALARVGNSGNTSEPHLHIHAVLNGTGDFLFSGTGIPMLFNGRFLVRNDRFKT